MDRTYGTVAFEDNSRGGAALTVWSSSDLPRVTVGAGSQHAKRVEDHESHLRLDTGPVGPTHCDGSNISFKTRLLQKKTAASIHLSRPVMPTAFAVPEPVLSSTTFPFRTTLLPIWPAGSEPLFESVRLTVDAIALMSQRGGSCPDAIVEEWARNPDERVTVALLSAGRIPLSKTAIDLITARAFRMARIEKAILTPVLDALLARYWTTSTLAGDDALPSEQARRALFRRSRELEAWLRSQINHLAALPLLAFSSVAVHDAVIGHGRRVPIEWIAFSVDLHPVVLFGRRVPNQCSTTAHNLLRLIFERAADCSDHKFVEIVWAIQDLACNCGFSFAECAQVDVLLTEREKRPHYVERSSVGLLRKTLAEYLVHVPRTSRVRASDLTRLLLSTCDAIARAAFDLAGELVHQPV